MFILGVLLGFVVALGLFFVIAPNNLPENLVNNVMAMGAAALITGFFLWGTVWIALRLLTARVTRKDFADFLKRRGILIAGVIPALVFLVLAVTVTWEMKISPNSYFFLQWQKELDLAETTFTSSLLAVLLVIVSAVLAQIIVNEHQGKERTGRMLLALGGSFLKKRADAYHLNNFLEHPDEEHNQYYFWLFVLKARMVIEELYRLGETNKRDILFDVVVTQLQEARRQVNGKPTEEVVSTALKLAIRFVNGEQLPRDETPKVLRALMLEMQQTTSSGQQLREVAAGAREPTELFSRGSAVEKTDLME